MTTTLSANGRIARLDPAVLESANARLNAELTTACELRWPATGPATIVIGNGQPDIFLKPTLVEATTGGQIRERGDVRIQFAFTESGALARYRGLISQNDLFCLLLERGYLHREVDE